MCPEKNESKRTMVATRQGERFDCCGETNNGVQFDGGMIPWEDVVGFWCWHRATKQWMFIPSS